MIRSSAIFGLAMAICGAVAAEPAIAPLSGARFVQLCAGVVSDQPIGASLEDSRCVGFVQGAVNVLDSLKGLGPAPYCRPDAVTVKDVILLFKSEAGLYPQVLDLPAADLIAGMLVKFFPCRQGGRR